MNCVAVFVLLVVLLPRSMNVILSPSKDRTTSASHMQYVQFPACLCCS